MAGRTRGTRPRSFAHSRKTVTDRPTVTPTPRCLGFALGLFRTLYRPKARRFARADIGRRSEIPSRAPHHRRRRRPNPCRLRSTGTFPETPPRVVAPRAAAVHDQCEFSDRRHGACDSIAGTSQHLANRLLTGDPEGQTPCPSPHDCPIRIKSRPLCRESSVFGYRFISTQRAKSNRETGSVIRCVTCSEHGPRPARGAWARFRRPG